jgi:hypothetical protein
MLWTHFDNLDHRPICTALLTHPICAAMSSGEFPSLNNNRSHKYWFSCLLLTRSKLDHFRYSCPKEPPKRMRERGYLRVISRVRSVREWIGLLLLSEGVWTSKSALAHHMFSTQHNTEYCRNSKDNTPISVIYKRRHFFSPPEVPSNHTVLIAITLHKRFKLQCDTSASILVLRIQRSSRKWGTGVLVRF